jgi:hypothetical protein
LQEVEDLEFYKDRLAEVCKANNVSEVKLYEKLHEKFAAIVKMIEENTRNHEVCLLKHKRFQLYEQILERGVTFYPSN